MAREKTQEVGILKKKKKKKEYHAKLPVKRLILSCLLKMIVLNSFTRNGGNRICIDYRKKI